MAQIGQTTVTGGRTDPIHNLQGKMRRMTMTEAGTVNHVGIWCWENAVANSNNLLAGIYSTAGVLLYQSNVRVAAVPGVGIANVAAVSVFFPGGTTLAIGSYDIVVCANGGVNGSDVICSGSNGTAGTPVNMFDAGTIYPTLPADYTGKVDTSASRQWDLFLDYTASSGKNRFRGVSGGFVDLSGGF